MQEFDALSAADAAALLRPCVAIDSWVRALVTGRPYGDAATLLATARRHSETWTPAEVDGALAGHPRIGERAAGQSRREQAGVDANDAVLAERLRAGNAAYEERFGRIYLVRAKGRSGAELADLLEKRLGNDDETEREVTRKQLAEIALLRLADLLDAEVTV